MSKPGAYDDYVTALQAVCESLDDVDAAVFVATRNALAEWAEESAVDAQALLNRPNWLLSQMIGSKVVQFLNDRKVQAMAGFRFQNKGNRTADGKETHRNKRGKTVAAYIPDPGYYGRFIEGGARKGGRPYSTRTHFLRSAKETNIATLKEIVERAFNAAKQDLLAGKLDEIKQARRANKNGEIGG